MFIKNILTKLCRLTDVISAFLVIAMVTHVSADVAGRYILNKPLPLTIEIVSKYYMVALVFLPLASTELRGRHIYVELVFEQLGARAQQAILGFVHAVSALAFALVAVQSWGAAVRSWKVGEYSMGAYSILVWPSRFLVPIGCALLTLVLLAKLFRFVGEATTSPIEEVARADA